MRKITISEELAGKVSELQLSCILCDVVPVPVNVQLWNEIQQKINEFASTISIEQISRIPAISASRKAYKACGKDPSRYRLSAEALMRRVVNRNELYQINNVVDALNLVSISTGFSIGGYDNDKIEGDVVFGIGQPGEPYFGIGRGELNIEGMPVFRDANGAFGTPTSDSERTSVTLETKRFLMIIIDYAASSPLDAATELAKNLLEKYSHAVNFEVKNITNYP
jgi:DNA/RNA-binding domain of Phe-tRNA-synthetase-like protein